MIRAFKPTSDDWYPSYHLKSMKLVEVKLLELFNPDGWRVCAWGADDFGMERDWLTWRGWFSAQSMFQKILEQDKVNQAFLRKQGFRRA